MQTEVVSYTVQRITHSSSKPFEHVLRDIHEELNAAETGLAMLQKIRAISCAEDLENIVAAATKGGRTFTFLGENAHSKWMDVYYNQKHRKTTVVTFGNPLVAKEFLKSNMSVGLHIPPKMIVQEDENGGTSISYDLPSSIMLGGIEPSPELKAMAEVMDGKVQSMVQKVLSV